MGGGEDSRTIKIKIQTLGRFLSYKQEKGKEKKKKETMFIVKIRQFCQFGTGFETSVRYFQNR